MILFIIELLASSSTQRNMAVSNADLASFVSEASQRFGIPEPVINAVIDVESHWRVRAISPRGAKGLMQLMPVTWTALRRNLNLGSDVFDPHDNIVAGGSYIRVLYDRYGWECAFAAYNSGPGRYESYLRSAKPLPKETRTYVALILRKLGAKTYAFAPLDKPLRSLNWTEANLFIDDVTNSPKVINGLSPTATPFVESRSQKFGQGYKWMTASNLPIIMGSRSISNGKTTKTEPLFGIQG